MTKRNTKHAEVLSGATFHRANTQRGAKTQAAVYAGNGQRSKVAQHGGKWGCWVWPKAKNPAWMKMADGRTKAQADALATKLKREDRKLRTLGSSGNYSRIEVRPTFDGPSKKEYGVFVVMREDNPKKRNPEAGAVAMREAFVGAPSKETIVVTEDVHVHEHLAALGELVQLKIRTLKGVIYTIGFGKEENPKKIGKRVAGWIDRRAKAIAGIGKGFAKTWLNPKKVNPNGAPILAVTEDGKNLMIVGGSQVLDLKALGMGEFADKESVIVGDIKTIDYFATKDWKDGKKPETAIYTHKMGEETGDLPLLRYDTRNRRIFIDGGRYHIKRPLFGSTSPGIEN